MSANNSGKADKVDVQDIAGIDGYGKILEEKAREAKRQENLRKMKEEGREGK